MPMRTPDIETAAALRAEDRAQRRSLANAGRHPHDPEYCEDDEMQAAEIDPAAPHWAEWLAMDADGTWHYYEFRPVRLRAIWGASEGREQLAPCRAGCADWCQSLAAVIAAQGTP